MYVRVCAAQEATISKMKEILEIYSYEINEIRSTHLYMWNYIGSCHKESDIDTSYLEHSTAHF